MPSVDEPLRLAKQHNSTTRLCSLPTEILVYVLYHLVVLPAGLRRGAYGFLGVEDNVKISPTWSRIMLVCSQIRHIALSVPELWSFIDFHTRANIRWINICFVRAGKHPLTLSFDDDEAGAVIGCANYNLRQTSPAVLDAIFRMLPHARSIAVLVQSTLPFDIINMLQQHPLPRLRSINLHISNFPFVSITGPQGTTLTRLSLTQVLLDTSTVFPSLTNLGLHNVTVGFDNDFHELLLFISRMPLLEVLVIENMNVDDPDLEDPKMNMTIPCTHLRTFATVQESFSISWCLLRALPDPRDGLHLDMTKMQQDVYADEPLYMFRLPPPGYNSAEDAMRHRVKQFRKTKTGKSSLGPAWMYFVQGYPCLSFGQYFDHDIASPSLLLRLAVEIENQDPWLSDVTHALYKASEKPDWPAFQKIDVLPNLKGLCIKEDIKDAELENLEDWIQFHYHHGGHLINLRFWTGVKPAMTEKAKRLKERFEKNPFIRTVVMEDLPEDSRPVNDSIHNLAMTDIDERCMQQSWY
jgi:hypothetical protein